MINFEDVEDEILASLQKKMDEGCKYLQEDKWELLKGFVLIKQYPTIQKDMFLDPKLTSCICISIIGLKSGIVRTFSVSSLIPEFNLDNVD